MATIEIPAGFVGAFRLGVVTELRSNSEWVHDMTKEVAQGELRRLQVEGRKEEDIPERLRDSVRERSADELADVRNSATAMGELIPIAEAAFATEGEEACTIEGDASALHYCCEAIVRTVVPKYTIDNLSGPIEGQRGAMAVQEAAELLTWAGAEAGRLQDLAANEMSLRREGVEV